MWNKEDKSIYKDFDWDEIEVYSIKEANYKHYKGKFIGQAGDEVYLIWQGYEHSIKQFPYHLIPFESRYADYEKGTVQKHFFNNRFIEPLLCKIERITYEFPSSLTYAYYKRNHMEFPTSLHWINQKIELKYNPY